MKRLSPVTYAVVAALAITPVGARLLLWPAPRLHAEDPTSAQAGRELFTHQWTAHDPLARNGDGLGPVFNADSCVACHNQGGVGGGGGLQHNVTTFIARDTQRGPAREGVVHSQAVRSQDRETLQHVHSALPPNVTRPTLAMLVKVPGHEGERINFPPGVHISQRNTPALFGAKLIDEIPDRVIIAEERRQRLRWGLAPTKGDNLPVGRALRLADGRVGKFGWKAQSASLSDFVQAACANELGLGNPGHPQPQPMGRQGGRSVTDDLTLEQCDQLTAFIAALPRPEERAPEQGKQHERIVAGKKLFHTIGCADCHTPEMGSVSGLYSDLLLHRMGVELEGGGSYNQPRIINEPISPGNGMEPDEWRTPPLWGVADSAPYLHDGRAATLEEAIRQHGGQGAAAAQRFERLGGPAQAQLIAFLRSLRAPTGVQ
jgi:CxxC motif-containing protein (DUF1111 family)